MRQVTSRQEATSTIALKIHSDTLTRIRPYKPPLRASKKTSSYLTAPNLHRQEQGHVRTISQIAIMTAMLDFGLPLLEDCRWMAYFAIFSLGLLIAIIYETSTPMSYRTLFGLFREQEKQPFPFLSLPAELRNRVYRYVPPSGRIRSQDHGYARRRGTRPSRNWKAIQVLFTNRHIYEEALCVLHIQTIFIFEIHPICEEMLDSAFTFRSLIYNKKLLTHLRHVELQINWPSYAYFYPRPPNSARSGFMKTKFTALGRDFAESLRLLDITISFQPEDALHHPGINLPEPLIPLMLNLLKLVRRTNPGVVINMPDGGPISGAELEE